MRGMWMAVTIGMGLVGGGLAYGQPPRFRVVRVLEQVPGGLPETIDDVGRVVGTAQTTSSLGNGAVWESGGGVTSLPGTSDLPASNAAGSNAAGQITGAVFNNTGVWPNWPFRAVIWENGQPRTLPTPGGFARALTSGLNAYGDAVGLVWNDDITLRNIAYWHDGAVTVIGTRHGSVAGVNNLRQVAGCMNDVRTVNDKFEAFLWKDGQYTVLPGGALGACAESLNNRGAVAGSTMDANGAQRPVAWENGAVVTLGPPATGGLASKINDRGEIIGYLGTRAFFRPASGGAALWDLADLVDLAPSEQGLGSVSSIYDLNNGSQILASMGSPEGPGRVVVLGPAAPSGSDRQPPTVTITAPASGSYLSDLAVLQATATDNVGVASVQFFANGAPVGAEITAPPYSVELDLLRFDRRTPVVFWARARDLSGNVSTTNLKSIVADKSCTTVARGTTANGWIGTQTGVFTMRWSASPMGTPAESGVAVALGKPAFFSGTSTTVLFAPDGQLRARNGNAYPASGPVYANDYYRFRMVVDVPHNRYSVWYRLPNQPEIQLAADYRFRTEATQLDNWMAHVEPESATDSLTLCNVRVEH
jgi:hypothetical protein